MIIRVVQSLMACFLVMQWSTVAKAAEDSVANRTWHFPLSIRFKGSASDTAWYSLQTLPVTAERREVEQRILQDTGSVMSLVC